MRPSADIPKNITQAESLLLKVIGQQDGPTLCGFLPIREDQGDAILDFAKRTAARDFSELLALIRDHPAVAVFSLSVGVSRGCKEGGQFWPAMKGEFGVEVSPAQRNRLALVFGHAVQKLGLLEGSIPNFAYSVAMPFVFQAGILHAWAKPLVERVKAMAIQGSMPDLHQGDELEAFCADLAGGCPPNLRHTLLSPAGPIFVRRLLAAWEDKAWQILPPHLAEPVQVAFERERLSDLVLKGPYLAYDANAMEVEIVLPAQPRGLATMETAWWVGNRQYTTTHERRLGGVTRIEAGVSVQLRGLGRGLKDRTYHLDGGLHDGHPFRLFHVANGREVRLDLSRGRLTVSAGEYCLLSTADAKVTPARFSREGRGRKEHRIEAKPGDDGIQLSLNNSTWTIVSDQQPVLILHKTTESHRLLPNGQDLCFGKTMSWSAWLPIAYLTEPVRVHCGTRNEVQKVVRETQGSAFSLDNMHGAREIRCALDDLLATLPPGIHWISLCIDTSRRSASRAFWFWKGLVGIQGWRIYRCEDKPQNVDFTHSQAWQPTPEGLEIRKNYRRPQASLWLSGVAEPVEFPSCGATAQVKAMDGRWEDLESEDVLTLCPGDLRDIRIQCSPELSWDLWVGGVKRQPLTPQSAPHVFSLQGLAGEAGGAGAVSVAFGSDERIILFQLARPRLSKNLEHHFDATNLEDTWSFRLASEGWRLLGLSIRCIKTHAFDLAEKPAVLEGVSQADGSEASSPDGMVSYRITDQYKGVVTVELTCRMDLLRHGLLIVRPLIRSTAEDEWQSLNCEEGLGLSDLVILIRGTSPEDPDATWWHNLMRLCPRNKMDSAPSGRLDHASPPLAAGDLRRLMGLHDLLLSHKFPTVVWERTAKYLADFILLLPKNILADAGESEAAAMWWEFAVSQLVRHARSRNAPVLAWLIFAKRPSLLLTRHQSRSPSLQDNSYLGRIFHLLGQLNHASNRTEALVKLFQDNALSSEIIKAHLNLSDAMRVSGTPLRKFDGRIFLEQLSKKAKDQQDDDEGHLFGVDHLRQSIRKMNQRVRVVLASGDASNNGLPVQIRRDLLRCEQQTSVHGASWLASAGLADHAMHQWTPPSSSESPGWIESEWGTKLNQLAWVLAACSCSTLRNPDAFGQSITKLKAIFQPSPAPGEERGLGLQVVLSFAPELFGFYLGFFSIMATSTL